MRWRRLTLRVSARDAEAASALLSSAAGAQVSIEGDDGKTGASVSAYVAQDRAAAALRAVRAALARARRAKAVGEVALSTKVVRDEDWATSWKRFYRPERIANGLWVVPSWRWDFRAPAGARAIVLDPGMAFGTGQHPTTKMAMQLMLPLVRTGEPALDIGCGSGILAIAAAQRGAKAYACDPDPLAVDATRTNFRANRLRAAGVRRASGVPKSFPAASLIVSNITADVLAPLARSFARALAPGGSLVTSGVTRRGRRELLAAFKAAGLRLKTERRSGEWYAHVHVQTRAKAR